MKLPSVSCVCSGTPFFAMSEANHVADRRVDVEAILARRRFLDEVTDAADDLARPKRTGVPSSDDADVGLHQRVDPFGRPQQRGADRSQLFWALMASGQTASYASVMAGIRHLSASAARA